VKVVTASLRSPSYAAQPMDTVRLQAIKLPSPVDVLLRELVQSLGTVPEGAREIADRTRLPTELRRLARFA
jgi:hypothetical protein